MPKINVNRSIEINAPIEQVFSKLNDFNHWQAWSPWLIMDPSTKVDVANDTKSYSWEGDRTGSGKMAITNESPNASIDYDLQFLKPWKSKAKVRFETKANGDSTTVSWSMDSSLPFFMFFMKKMMVAFIGMDYDRGLRLLKDYVEDGKVHSVLNFNGNERLNGFKYIGVKTSCTRETMGQKMSESLPQLTQYLNENGLQAAGAPFTQYHKWDMVNNHVEYVTGIPVADAPASVSGNFHVGEIPSTKVYTLEHKGPYMHLGNAWSTLYTMQRTKEFKLNKKIHPFETYHNKPGEVADDEIITQVHFPIV